MKKEIKKKVTKKKKQFQLCLLFNINILLNMKKEMKKPVLYA